MGVSSPIDRVSCIRQERFMTRFDELFQMELARREARGLRRVLRPVLREAGGVRRDGRVLLDFSSNDYLGLSGHPLLAERAGDWAARYGAGARASRVVTGTLEAHRAVEARVAAFKGTEDALLFASGWQANASVLPALFEVAEGGALVFTDRLNHASLHHGCAAAGVRQIRFRHNDLAHLEVLLERHGAGGGTRFVVTESVFSMDGDRADVGALRALCDRFGAFLFVDEAHATGVLGEGGRGLAGGVADLAMGTFSKAFGGFGAYVAGSRALCDWLVNRCSGFVYSTALPPAVLGAMDAALDLVPGMGEARAGLLRRAGWLRGRLNQAGLETGDSTTQIVPVLLGESGRALAVAEALAGEGILGMAIRPPTVPAGTARLRLALSAAHGDGDVERLAEAVCRVAS